MAPLASRHHFKNAQNNSMSEGLPIMGKYLNFTNTLYVWLLRWATPDREKIFNIQWVVCWTLYGQRIIAHKLWYAKNNCVPHTFLPKLYINFDRKELCKSRYSGYSSFGLQNMSSKPNIPKSSTFNGLSVLVHQEFSISLKYYGISFSL